MAKTTISLVLITVVSMCFIGCGEYGDTTGTTNTGDTISNDAKVAFVGKVVDPLGNPMSDVNIELISDSKQTKPQM